MLYIWYNQYTTYSYGLIENIIFCLCIMFTEIQLDFVNMSPYRGLLSSLLIHNCRGKKYNVILSL